MRRLGKIPKKNQSRWLVLSALIVIILLFLILLLILLVENAVEVHKLPTEENQRQFNVTLEVTKTITSAIGTIATAVGGFILYLNCRVANRNAEISEDKQVAERFSKAIEQLGNTAQQQVRLGGIYSLERIAKDSPDDLWTIVEVLSSFIREYAASASEDETHLPLVKADVQNQVSENKELRKLPTDIQAAFTVIDRIYKQRTDDRRIDLQEIDLSNTRLSSINLSGADLKGANLSGADLKNTNLIYADLSSANLNSANFKDASLGNTNLNGSKLRSTNFESANLTNADLKGADLESANLTNADLEGAKLSSANLKG